MSGEKKYTPRQKRRRQTAAETNIFLRNLISVNKYATKNSYIFLFSNLVLRISEIKIKICDTRKSLLHDKSILNRGINFQRTVCICFV